MRSSRVLVLVVPMVVAAILTPAPTFATNVGTSPSLACTAGVAVFFGGPQDEDCLALARDADDAYGEWRAASRAADAVRAIYGIFSGEYVVAVIIRESRRGTWEDKRDAWAESCHEQQ